MRSAVLGEVRLVRAFVPDGARSLLFLNDGQNVFTRPRAGGAPHRWRADETAPRVAPRLAIFAIDHAPGSRPRDYLPYPDPAHPARARPRADRYARFVVEELVGWVGRRYPALARPEHRGIGGSSYGAVAALWTVMTYAGTFDRLHVESAPLWVGDGRLLDDARRCARWPERAWVGVGTAESRRPDRAAQLVSDALTLARAMARRGSGVEVRVVEGAGHDERAWAARLPDALVHLFG